MFEEKAKQVSYKEELVLFYNKYLNIGIGEMYLTRLVKKYHKIWMNKKEKVDSSIQSRTIFQKAYLLKMNEQDYYLFNKVEQEFVNFYPTSVIEINDDYDIVIDQMGMIQAFFYKTEVTVEEKSELESFIGTSIFSFFDVVSLGIQKEAALKAAEDVILQNILASKIVRAVFEEIAQEENQLSASLFAVTNAQLFQYEDDLTQCFNYETRFSNKLARVRSLR